jgi:toxin ParE1/3/4
MQVRFTPLAEADLIDIAMYIAQDNPERALSFVDELEEQCQKLGRNPLIGAQRPELGEALRVWPHGRYLIFYQPNASTVTIARVLHSSRDISEDDFI